MVVLEDAWPERYEWLEDGLTPEQAMILLSLLQENGELLTELLDAFVQEATGPGTTPQPPRLLRPGDATQGEA